MAGKVAAASKTRSTEAAAGNGITGAKTRLVGSAASGKVATSGIVAVNLRRLWRGVVSSWWVLLLIAGYVSASSFLFGTGCMVASTVGLPCPGCGVTRATVALVHGDVATSFAMHPLLIPSLALAVAYAGVWVTHERVPHRMDTAMLALGVALIAVYAARMALLFPAGIAPMAFNDRSILARAIALFTG